MRADLLRDGTPLPPGIVAGEEGLASPEWYAAIAATVSGEMDELLAALSALSTKGEDVRSRRVAVSESSALREAEGAEVEAGKLLVELALDHGQPHIVDLLFSYAELMTPQLPGVASRGEGSTEVTA